MTEGTSPSCSRVGCDKPACWIPVLVMRPVGSGPSEPAARAEIQVWLCTPHRRTMQVKDFLSDKLWNEMCALFESRGKLLPDRDGIELDFMHMKMGYVN